MNTFLKRLGAYAIDYILINFVIYAIMFLPFINPKNEEYQTKYNEIININEQLMENEISQDEFQDAFVPIAYDLYRLNSNYVIVSTICFILYFGIYQFYNKGQTIGKKIFKLKVISNNKKELSLTSYILRAIVLYNILIPIIELIIVYTMSVDNYLPVYQNVNMVGYIIMYITIFMVLVRKDGRGLHDFVAMSKVIYDEELPTYKFKDKVIEIKEEINKTNKKTNTKKTSTKKTKPSKK